MHCSVPHTGQVRYLLQEPGPPQRQVPADFGLRLLQLIRAAVAVLAAGGATAVVVAAAAA